MKKYFFISCVLLLLTGCQQFKPSDFVSDDGKLRLKFDSLPNGVNESDIKITWLNPDESLTVDAEKPLAVYKLEPDGLQLPQPAKFMLSLPMTNGRVPGAYLASKDGIASVTNLEGTIEQGLVTLTGEIHHFSALVIRSEDFDLSIRTPKYVFVGQSFDVSGKVDKVTEKREMTVAESGTEWFDILVKSLGLNPNNIQPKQVIGELEIKDPWSVRDKLNATDGSPVDPKFHEEARQDVNGNTHTYTRQFTCTNPGFITIEYIPLIQTPNTSYKNMAPNNVDMSTRNFSYTIRSDEIECIDYVVCNGMKLDEAVGIASEACDGAFTGGYVCNDVSKTFWLDLDLEKEGCSPACVVDTQTKKAEVNSRCTGLIPS